MSDRTAIRAEHLSKKFASSLKRAMWYGLVDVARGALVPDRFRSPGYESRMKEASSEASRFPSDGWSAIQAIERAASGGVRDPSLRPSEFWALHDLSFELRQGQCLGLIGANGAGKSTLFSILSGIYGPSEGRVETRGRLQALIALGAGFHPMLSGRENIYINAAIFGMSTREVDRKLDEILDFAEIGDFVDAPIKMYSSGMLVRLGFSVAAHLDPDILLIDEVLAVGDASFQMKCQKYSRKLVHSGKTMMVVAHNMLVIQAMCSEVLWLHRGRLVKHGETDDVVREYKDYMVEHMTKQRGEDSGSYHTGRPATIREVNLIQDGRPCSDDLAFGRPLTVRVEIESSIGIDCARIWLAFQTVKEDCCLLGASMYEDGHYLSLVQGRNVVELVFPDLPIHEDVPLRLSLGIRDWACQTMLADSYATPILRVRGGRLTCGGKIGEAGTWSTGAAALVLPYEWRVESGGVLHDTPLPSEFRE